MAPGGEYAVYYFQKAPIREYADDLILDRISDLPYEQVATDRREITELGYEEGVAINYDWYHPQRGARHMPDEARALFQEAGFQGQYECVIHMASPYQDVDPSK